MKRTVVMTILILLVAGVWFWPRHEVGLRVIVMAAHSGSMGGRDAAMVETLRRTLNRVTESNIVVEVVDSLLSRDDMQMRFDEILAKGPVAAVLGCGDSACVRQVLPVLEQSDLVLLYPGSSEGLFKSRHVIHLGVVANQYLFPAVSWVRQNLGGRIQFLGTESARSAMLLRLISRQLLVTRDAQIVASDFMSNIEQLPSIIDKINFFKADVLVMDACEWMFDRQFNRELSKTGVKIFSLCVDQSPPSGVDMYFISHYFENPHNHEIHRLKADLRGDLDGLTILSELSATWLGEAFNRGRTLDNRSLLEFVLGRNALTAGGAITVDHAFQGTWHTLYIAQVRNNEQQLLWISNTAIRPVMFPGLEAPSDWLHNLTIYWRNAGGLWRATSVGKH
ncbi:MAG: hypothetical protein COB58_10705 [Thalassobium sp.]|jgi:urea transport system substrate-binding protein|uniref:transporter substrate-binding protein n=1 Tax=Thalassolituus oleivorans TaxID=187493 RepID=UPI000BD429A5|nr:transporter substrate-binding protein [Thalassolituus oleivorans]PCI48771.1 MAG: hypothetical protein COB43_06950 [Oceanospirillales bacterium]PHQ84484.1 MAG: hypothetical protein COB58_10705 [Thalassobium sp.]